MVALTELDEITDRLSNAMMEADEAEHGTSGAPEWYERMAAVAVEQLAAPGQVKWAIFAKGAPANSQQSSDNRWFQTRKAADAVIDDTYLYSFQAETEARPFLLVPLPATAGNPFVNALPAATPTKGLLSWLRKTE